jgi:hypothetical protein
MSQIAQIAPLMRSPSPAAKFDHSPYFSSPINTSHHPSPRTTSAHILLKFIN